MAAYCTECNATCCHHLLAGYLNPSTASNGFAQMVITSSNNQTIKQSNNQTISIVHDEPPKPINKLLLLLRR